MMDVTGAYNLKHGRTYLVEKFAFNVRSFKFLPCKSASEHSNWPDEHNSRHLFMCYLYGQNSTVKFAKYDAQVLTHRVKHTADLY